MHRPWPDVHRVVAGDVAVDIAPEGLRHLTVRGREVAANLYAAVRARDWGTLPTVPVSAQLDSGRSSITLRRVETVGECLRSVLEVSWAEPGILTATVSLTVLADAEINRWGFNVCLHAGDWAGAQVLGPGQPRLPRDVAPQRAEGGVLKGLFPPLPRLDLRRPDGAVVRIVSDGQLLEAEDQRNWTDPTFKIYSGSLGDPLPLAVRSGGHGPSTANRPIAVSRSASQAWQRASPANGKARTSSGRAHRVSTRRAAVSGSRR